jgi:hypothetical protein
VLSLTSSLDKGFVLSEREHTVVTSGLNRPQQQSDNSEPIQSYRVRF